MAYRLRPGKQARKQLSRIVAKELGRVADALRRSPPPDEAVHDARKRVKKIRAILRLLRSSLGTDYRRHNDRLRAVAHQLSAIRDADALIEMMNHVRRHYPTIVTPAVFAAVRQGLRSKKRGTKARSHSDRRWPRLLREVKRSARALPPRIRETTRVAAIRRGLLRGYRDARDTMRAVQADPADLAFHAWRRRVKDHWYHIRLLDSVQPSTRARARQLKRLETWLGDDHNLVLLRTTILEAPSRFGDERTTAIVLGCMEKYQATLRRRAATSGKALFTRKPRLFARSLAKMRIQ
jgi:CHAD domain-containing protein